ncbi:MAG: 4-hydroxy-tetrahydrodipicolinate synthase [Ruminiclostridium sp.]|nr:4-hydroxy-tetrahydrodipicolinate synthase [Ruminiclostridium sp.]
MKNTIFTGAAVAIVTPMNADGSINYDVFADIIEEQIAGGTDAIVVCGTTGEASTMTDEEHIEAIRFTVEKVAKRIPVIAGTGSNDTGYAIELSKQAEAVGADALLQVTPYYNKTSQRGLVAHFTAIADAVNIPIILYDVPSRTGMTISVDTYIELAKHPNIVATKEASGNFSLIAEIAAKTDLDIYSGNDDQVLGVLAFGGKGVISVSSNVIPREKHDMVMLYMNGEREKALQLQNKYLDMENAMFIDVNPIPVKEAMNLMGKNVGECRLPLVKMETAKIEKLRAELAKVGLV